MTRCFIPQKPVILSERSESKACPEPAKGDLRFGDSRLGTNSRYFDKLSTYLFSVLIPPQDRYLFRFGESVLYVHGDAG